MSIKSKLKTRNSSINIKRHRKNKIDHRKKAGLVFNYNSLKNTIIIKKEPIRAPRHFSYLEHPLECNYFFSSLRLRSNCSIIRGKVSFRICLKNIVKIDFAAISILKSIMEEARLSGIEFSGSLPIDKKCREFLIDYGFLNNLEYNGDRNIKIESNGKYFIYEKKSGKMSLKDLEDIHRISSEAYKVLTQNEGILDEIVTILKEIGGNAVEWSQSKNKQWMIGYYESEEKVIINVTDLGKGILETLFRDNRLKMIDMFFWRNYLDILDRAFQRKYGSLSQEINRNSGLPSIKRCFDEKKIKNLVVSTNNIFFNFERRGECKISRIAETNFLGTFYQWEIDKQCIKNYE